MSAIPLETTYSPEASELLDEIGRGMIPAPGRIVAAVEAYPGPTPDFRSLLITETLKESRHSLGIRRGEAAVIVGRTTTAREMLRYQRAGWRPYRMDDLMTGVLGDSDYRHCLGKSAPRQRQAQAKKMLQDLSAPSSALWPVLRTLDAFYLSDDGTPGHQHLSGWTRNEADVVRLACILWDRQCKDPLGSGLGLSRLAMPKYWQHRHGGAWPEMPPDLLPKLLVIAQAEEMTPTELRLLGGQPCPVLFFGDPAVGVLGATPSELNTHPLGSHVLGELHATTLGCEQGLERAIHHVIRNDVEIPDAWVQTVGALSAVSLRRQRPGFAAYRRLTHTPDARPHHPPLSSPDARPNAIVSRTGVAALRHLLDALRPVQRLPPAHRPKIKLQMDNELSDLIKEAHEVAQVFYQPEDQWDRQISQRYRKGRDAALDMFARSPRKAAILDFFKQREDPALAGVLRLLRNIEYRGSRVIHAGGIKDADQADGQEAVLKIGDPPDLRHLKGVPVTIVEAELGDAGSGNEQAACLYRVLSQRPVEISPTSDEAIEFLERAHDWLAVKRAPDATGPAAEVPASDVGAFERPTQTTPAETPAGVEGHVNGEQAASKEAKQGPAGEAPSNGPEAIEGEPWNGDGHRQDRVPPDMEQTPQQPTQPNSSSTEAGRPASRDELEDSGTELADIEAQAAGGRSAPAQRMEVPPALSEWAAEVYDDARQHEEQLVDEDLESSLWEYHQNTYWRDVDSDSTTEVPLALAESVPEPGESISPAHQTYEEESSSMKVDIQEEGTRKQAALQTAWHVAAEGILKRKADKLATPSSVANGPSPGG